MRRACKNTKRRRNIVFPYLNNKSTLYNALFCCLLIILCVHYSSTPLRTQDDLNQLEITLKVSLDSRLNITNPREGDIISGVITIEWNVDEAYIDDTTSYQVHYSTDDGNNWIILTMFTFNPYYVWNTTVYEEYTTQCRIQVSYQSKNFENFQVISERFTIDNRIPAKPIDLTGYFLILGSIMVLGVGLWKFRPWVQQKSILQVIQSEKQEWLTALSHKIIIGLDNIKSEFIEEIPQITDVKTISLTTSIVDIFPQNLRHDLQHNMKGRTVLTLIEMAYLGPHETTPTKIAKSLNIPLSTLSKEIKKLETTGYVETYLTTQMLQDARLKNFVITKKGFELLSNLDTALKIAIERLR